MAPALVASAVITLEPGKLLAQAPASAPTFTLPSSLPDGSTVRIDGSPSMAVPNKSLQEQFLDRFAGSNVTISTNGTEVALQELLRGTIDLAAIGRNLTATEANQGLTAVPLERAKIAIIVGPNSPFQGDLTFEQFAKIFRGEITDWSQLGGAPGPIRFVDRPESSDTRQAFRNYPVFQTAPFTTGATADPVSTDDTAAVISALGDDGIGYAVADQVSDRSDVRIVAMHKTLPSDSRYPFSQPRFYVYRGTPSLPVQAFLGIATGASAQAPGQPAAVPATPGAAPATATPQPAPAAVTAPAATATPQSSPAEAIAPPATTAPAETAQAGGISPWWWLLLPIVGIPLLAWLLKGKGAPPAVAPLAAADTTKGRMVLTPRDCRHAYAYWEVPAEQLQALQQQGGRDLKLRLYDVTDWKNAQHQRPEQFQEFDCSTTDPDLHLPISRDDRDYIAALGYKTADGRWLEITHSAPVRVPACTTSEKISQAAQAAIAPSTAGVMATGAGAAAVAQALKSPAPVAQTVAAQSAVGMPAARIILVPRNAESAYAYWEVPDALKAELRRQGGRDLKLRIHDATDLNLDTQAAHSTQEYTVSELDQDRHVPIPVSDRDYVAELGYTTQDGRWLSLARSEHIHVASDVPASSPQATTVSGVANSLTTSPGGMAAAISTPLGNATEAAIAASTTALGGVGAIAHSLVEQGQTLVQSAADCSIRLTPVGGKTAFVVWNVDERYRAALRQQGGRKLMLRIHDATNLNIEHEAPHNTQTYLCSEGESERTVTVLTGDRDYVAELGYMTDDGRWLSLVHSAHARVPNA
ncbi:MAG TPA: DUF4912 domain-containing protein [Synechococcales cyanobacterium M55_K2018_004]|nr:DUF4912 domain-containing protein [Synechococcales cyanobacterium M55_K2018_004]